MSRIRVLLADDHPVVRKGLRTLLEAQPDMEVVGDVADGLAAIHNVMEQHPDVVVMDVSMPEVNGAEATEQLRQSCPVVKVLALTGHEDRGYLQLLLKSGAAGYILKRAAATDLVRAVRIVAAGETYIDPAVARQLLPTHPPAVGPADFEAELSDREAEVVQLIAQGYTIKQIATRLSVGARSIETYKSRATEKLGLKTRADLVRYALRRGWLTSG